MGLKTRISKLTSTFNRYFIRSILDFGEIQCYESGKKFLEQLEELMQVSALQLTKLEHL